MDLGIDEDKPGNQSLPDIGHGAQQASGNATARLLEFEIILYKAAFMTRYDVINCRIPAQSDS